MEINPLVLTKNNEIIPLDFAVTIDETALYLFNDIDNKFTFTEVKSNKFTFTEAKSNKFTKQENNILDLDSKTGASLKFNLINPNGRIWTLVAGGGASVAYTDAIINMGKGNELANYGEYSGNPNSKFVELYTTNIFELLFESNAENKILIIGGAIANFTRVDITFDGIIKSITKFSNEFKKHNIKIYVRRGGPQYQIGLNNIKTLCNKLNVYCNVFGPEKFITDIVRMALTSDNINDNQLMMKDSLVYKYHDIKYLYNENLPVFDKNTKVFVWGQHIKLVQRMLDYDYACGKTEPSVVCLLDGNKKSKSYLNFFWNDKEILIPVINNFKDACLDFPEADTLINLASFRSAYQVTL